MKMHRRSNRDFTLEKYKELCKTIIESDYTPLTFSQYFSADTLPNKFVMLRHDVDRKPEQALKMAQIERNFGISSTYYFRTIAKTFKPDLIKATNNLGHEIGYHYEVLDKAKGDFEKAIKIFEDELIAFRGIYDVKTICMHGNPLSKWDNRDLWEKYDFRDFDIIGEPYLSIDYTTFFYLTDTGRSWSSKFSVKDVVSASASHTFEKINSIDDVMRMIKKGDIERLCIVVHPERWNDSFGAWLRELVWQSMKNVGKAGIIKYRNTFYD